MRFTSLAPPRLALSGAAIAIATATATATLAALLAPGAAAAGSAQVGSSIGTYSSWDLDSASVTGTAWRDAVVVQTVNVSGDPAFANVQVGGGLNSAHVRLDGQGVLRDGSAAGLPFSGHREVQADLPGGMLQLGAATGYVGYSVAPNPYRREAWVQGYPFAELFENFDIRYDAGRVDPVVISLRMTITGSLTGNSGANGRVNGVQAYLGLGNVAAHDQFESLWRTETSVVGEVITLSGSPINAQCPVGKTYCESFLNLYAAIDLRSRGLAGGDIGFTSGAPFAADFQASLALDSSPGVTLLRLDNLGNLQPQFSWVNAAPVPEPGAAQLLLAGLAAMALHARRRSRLAAAWWAGPITSSEGRLG